MIENGYALPEYDFIEEGEVYEVICHDNYTLQGNSEIECMENGNLSSIPTCITGMEVIASLYSSTWQLFKTSLVIRV